MRSGSILRSSFTRLHTQTHTHTRTHTHTCMRIHTHAHTHMHMHAYTHTHTHTHTHIHTHTRKCTHTRHEQPNHIDMLEMLQGKPTPPPVPCSSLIILSITKSAPAPMLSGDSGCGHLRDPKGTHMLPQSIDVVIGGKCGAELQVLVRILHCVCMCGSDVVMFGRDRCLYA